MDEEEYNRLVKSLLSHPDIVALNFYLPITGGWYAYLESIGEL
jgi:hypothetical protein